MDGMRILVVDDCKDLRDMLQAMLEDDGHCVTVAANGEEACSCFTHEPFDLVISDMEMPRGNGIYVLNHVKSKSPGTAVIILSALNDFRTAKTAVTSGCDALLPKPLPSIQALQQAIRTSLQKTRNN